MEIKSKYYEKTYDPGSKNIFLKCKQCQKRICKGDDYLEAHYNFHTFCKNDCILDFENQNKDIE